MYKKLLALFIVCVLALVSVMGLTACNNPDDGGDGDNGGNNPPPTYSQGLAYELNTAGTGYILTGLGTCSDKNIVIPAQYNGKDVVEIGDNAFNDKSAITSFTIPSTVKVIGVKAFHWCTGVTKIVIPNSVTTIKEQAFRYMSNLTDLEIGSGVTTIEDGAFAELTTLENVVFKGTSAQWQNVTLGDGVWLNSTGLIQDIECADGEFVAMN